ncbi:MAG: small GTP-binding protein [Promethearchaeota archaeon CR_4]|nr:MAG: small GTP-binding protein [Candidatus Lokiarchaeota archaeon CR_4]
MKNQLDTLLKNYVAKLNLDAAAVVDRQGLIISSVVSPKIKEDEQLGAITALVDSLIDRIKKEFGGKQEFSNYMNVEDRKFLFTSAGTDAILTSLATAQTDDNALHVFGKYVAEKASRIIAQQANVPLIFPPILDLLGKFQGGKMPKRSFATKVILCGDYQVGKTSLIRRYVEEKFMDSYATTIGVDITKKTISIAEGCQVEFLIWDIAGQRKQFHAYRSRFYAGASCVFIVYDKTRPDSFASIDYWLNDIKSVITESITIMLVGNKSDLVSQEKIMVSQLATKAAELGVPFIETSAKTGENITEAFTYMAYQIVSKS